MILIPIYSQLPSISGGRLLRQQPEGVPCHAVSVQTWGFLVRSIPDCAHEEPSSMVTWVPVLLFHYITVTKWLGRWNNIRTDWLTLCGLFSFVERVHDVHFGDSWSAYHTPLDKGTMASVSLPTWLRKFR
jgi:hypothetical protein